MISDDRKRVKTVFFNAIDLPKDAREAFIKEALEGQSDLEDEVRSLLEHHETKTLLPEQAQAQTATVTRTVALPEGQPVVKEATGPAGETSLVLLELWTENRALLQKRLLVLATVLGVLVAYAIITRLFSSPPLWASLCRGICLLVDVACISFLARRQASLSQLRVLEIIIMLNVGGLIAVTDMREMVDLSRDVDPLRISSTNLWNYISWSLLILTYGIFIPNTWQRAAKLLIPIAAIPYLVDVATQQLYPAVAQVLAHPAFDQPFPLPFIAAGISISAAKVIHSARLTAFKAKRFAQYELVREIGAGGMGKVYEARHVMLKRPCAIKIIQPERSSDSALIDFEKEVHATSQLTHPNTIAIYDFGQTNHGLFFYVMELLPGLNLHRLVSDFGSLPPARAIHFLFQICGALQEAHGMGLIHRDIKPANIFASQRGGVYDFAKLLDFGLVHQIETESIGDHSGSNFTAGTPAYMSPEQIVSFHEIDARSDIYSLGAVAYFLLAGRPPFTRKNDAQVLLAHINDEVEAPLSIQPQIGFELNQIILTCLAKKPQDRYQSASELGRALKACSMAQNWNQQAAIDWWHSHVFSENAHDDPRGAS